MFPDPSKHITIFRGGLSGVFGELEGLPSGLSVVPEMEVPDGLPSGFSAVPEVEVPGSSLSDPPALPEAVEGPGGAVDSGPSS